MAELSMDDKIKRINELAHISKERALTPEEKEEQAILRRAFLDSVRANLRAQLDNIEIVEADGSITKVTKKK